MVAGPVPAALHARGSQGCNAGFVALGDPRLGFDLIPLGSGIVVEVVEVEVELAANSTVGVDALLEPEVGVKLAALVVAVVVVLDAAGFNVSPMPVWTVTSVPGVTSEGL